MRTWEQLADDGTGAFDQGVDWAARQEGGHGLLHRLESLARAVESLANRLIGNLQLNPFYNTDTIAVFLLVVAVVSGLYLVVFFPVRL
jgi:hypothetical protein